VADSLKLTVLTTLTRHLERITPSNGYEFNLEGAVFRGRSRFGENDPPTMLSILESPKPDFPLFAGENNAVRHEQWNLLLQGWAKEESDVPSSHPTDQTYRLIADVENQLRRLTATTDFGSAKYPDEYLLGRMVSDINFGFGVVRPPTEQVSNKAFFYLPLRIGLAA
jgi:hypothetical protein